MQMTRKTMKKSANQLLLSYAGILEGKKNISRSMQSVEGIMLYSFEGYVFWPGIFSRYRVLID